MLFVFVLEAAGIAALLAVSLPKYRPWVRENGLSFRDGWFAAAGLWTIDRLRLMDRLSELTGKVHAVMAGLFGRREAGMRTKWFYACVWSWMAVALLFSSLLGWAAGNAEMPAYGAAIAIFIPLVQYKRLTSRLEQRKRAMLLELPEALNRIMLLVNAGETVPQALQRIVEARERSGASAHPLWAELSWAVRALQMNASFPKVMEEFSKRCALQEASMFTTTLLLNYRRGGDELVMSLKELSFTLWERRKALAKTLGEEASSKMVFPMVLIFFAVMVVVAAPALLMMNG